MATGMAAHRELAAPRHRPTRPFGRLATSASEDRLDTQESRAGNFPLAPAPGANADSPGSGTDNGTLATGGRASEKLSGLLADRPAALTNQPPLTDPPR